MNRAFLTIAAIAVIALPLSSHAEDTVHAARQPDARAMLFSIYGNLTVGTFDGTVISFQKQTAPNHARRFDLSFGAEYADDDLADKKVHNVDVQAGLSWISIVRPERDVRFYWGFGPMASFEYSKNPGSYTDYKEESFEIGGRALYGVEWLVKDNFSIFAEHRVNLTYGYTDVDYASTNSSDWIVRVAPENVAFGIAVWF